MTTPQPRNRTPEGTPGGGQFASETGSRPSGSLASPAAPPITAGRVEAVSTASRAFEAAREYHQLLNARLAARIAAEQVMQVWPTAARVTLRERKLDYSRFYLADEVFDADDVLLASVETSGPDFDVQKSVMELDAEADLYISWGQQNPDGGRCEDPYLDVTACLKLPLDEPANPAHPTGLSAAFEPAAIRRYLDDEDDQALLDGLSDADLQRVGNEVSWGARVDDAYRDAIESSIRRLKAGRLNATPGGRVPRHARPPTR
jgi:hypothetical protein